ncbi:MAG: glycosyltransferase [Blastocatellia bacterium]
MQSRSGAAGYSTRSGNSESAWSAARQSALAGAQSSPAIDTSPYKILLYSHDTFGLGNIRRTLLLTQDLIRQYPKASILVVTGSPMIHAFRIPEGVDYIKLPCLDRIEADRYEPRFLSDCSEEMKRTRRAILEKSVLGFAPDLMIVDKRPAGVDGELLESLRALQQRERRPRLVLGLRDILDEPERTRLSLLRHECFDLIERFYDEVWVYGSQSIFDPTKEYDFPDSVKAKTFFCGYLKRPTEAATRDGGPPRVLVTTGGGGDGSRMIEAYLEGLSVLPRNVALETTVIFGPQMPESKRDDLLERFGFLADVTFLDFEPDLTKRYAEADVVVSMAGYNTVCELLSFARRAILVPRSQPVMEQLIRARLLARQGLFDLVEPQDLSPETLMGKVLAAFKPAAVAATPLDLDGLPRIRARVRALLKGESR